MTQSDPEELRFLESAENIKSVLRKALGRTPSSEVAKGVSICLQQGRMFFESASSAPTEIRPLLLYYGMMAFAKAIVAARSMRSHATLGQSHGLRDISVSNALLSELRVAVEGRGTFQEFNDAVCQLEGVVYFQKSMTQWQPLPTADSAHIDKTRISLKDVLARTMGLQTLFRATFGEEAAVLPFDLIVHDRHADHVEIRIDIPELFLTANRSKD